jgi:hypothetical protein
VPDPVPPHAIEFVDQADPVAPPPPAIDPAPVTANEPTRPVVLPKSGTGNIVNGASMIGAGLTVAAPLALLGAEVGGRSFGFLFTLPAIVATAGGAGFLTLGIVRERRANRWAHREGLTLPPSGKGLMAGGVWVAAAGTAATVIGVSAFGRNPDRFNQNIALGVGASVASGLGLLAWGAVRQVRRERWAGQLRATPYAMATHRGFSIGVAGRF